MRPRSGPGPLVLRRKRQSSRIRIEPQTVLPTGVNSEQSPLRLSAKMHYGVTKDVEKPRPQGLHCVSIYEREDGGLSEMC